VAALVLCTAVTLWAGGRGLQTTADPQWPIVETETMRHFQAILKMDTSAGNERVVADYVKQVLEAEGIPATILANDPARANVVARLRGSGRKRPMLLMGHSDVVNVDAAKWTTPPFGATRQDGYVYGRGAVDDKDNLVASLMTVLLLKRLGIPLDRDVILVVEAGEEGATQFGIDFLVREHFAEIDAEYCIAEGGGVRRVNGQATYAAVATTEKIPRGVHLTARGVAGHGSVPLSTNAVVRLSRAVARVGEWRPEIRLNETTATYFRRLAEIAAPETARYYRDVTSPDPAARAAADDWFFEHEPLHSSMLRTSVSPNIFTAGYRYNVIPSEAKARLDIRMLPDEDPTRFVEELRRRIDDPTVEVTWATDQSQRPGAPPSRLDAEAYKVLEAAVSRVYGTVTVPTMLTGATDMSFLRANGMQCFGIGPAVDLEDGPKGFGAHSDQERILESELHRFVRFTWDAVTTLAGAR
jgi:acetylornithine deacetylase/succinyl-diaminopimelate desuccinylase-like protein